MRSVQGFRLNILSGLNRYRPDSLSSPALLHVDTESHLPPEQFYSDSVLRPGAQNAPSAAFIDCNRSSISLVFTAFVKKFQINVKSYLHGVKLPPLPCFSHGQGFFFSA
jgi:hypothetical protein